MELGYFENDQQGGNRHYHAECFLRMEVSKPSVSRVSPTT